MANSDLDKELDERLRTIDVEVQGLVGSLGSNPFAIEEIRQAFADAGYGTVTKMPYRDRNNAPYTQITIDYANGSGEYVRVPESAYMTGIEWYTKLEKQLDSYAWTRDEKDSILQAAFEVAEGIE